LEFLDEKRNQKGENKTHRDSLRVEIYSVNRILSKEIRFLKMEKRKDG